MSKLTNFNAAPATDKETLIAHCSQIWSLGQISASILAFDGAGSEGVEILIGESGGDPVHAGQSLRIMLRPNPQFPNVLRAVVSHDGQTLTADLGEVPK